MMAGSSVPFRKIAAHRLAVSEPPPQWFGNGPNTGATASGRPWTNGNWLKSRFHFSFAEYSNPGNAEFGVLRVLNDDLVQPARGFGRHGHANMEICTYILEGDLTHRDSMGNGDTLGRGSVQFMSAGRGVQHEEHNLDPEAPLRFCQIWIKPWKHGLDPNYGSFAGTDASLRTNRLQHLVAPATSEDAGVPVKIQADAHIHVTELTEAGKRVGFDVAEGRQAYVLQAEGTASFEGAFGKSTLERHDAAEVRGPIALNITALEAGAHVLIIEMAAGKGGRTDIPNEL